VSAAELIVFEQVRARRFCGKDCVRLSERDLEQAKRVIIAARNGCFSRTRAWESLAREVRTQEGV
jgi:hypothetical protein